MTNEMTTRGFRSDNGLAIRFLMFNGQWVCLARQVSTWLGYTDAGTLVRKVRGDWSDEFEAGEDFMVLQGQELRDLRALMTESVIGHRASSVMLLTKEGVYATVLKSGQPRGKALRKWLRREVFPALEQDGRYELRQGDDDARIAIERDRLAVERERLAVERQRLNLASELMRGHGLTAPVRARHRQMPRETEQVRRFLGKCCGPFDEGRTPTGELYSAYAEWSQRMACRTGGPACFGRAMSTIGLAARRAN
ncbi:MAG: BRO family protein, partial [Myxococcota bacterium]